MCSHAQELTLLGVCDGELDPRRYRCSYLTNKVGGDPDRPPGLSRRSPRCGHCGAPLAHVVQVYCPLQASPYHRTLQLFACTTAGCGSESWRVLRSQCLEEDTHTPSRPAPAQEAPLSATDWCDTADDWGEDGDDGWGVKRNIQAEVEAAAPATPDHPAEHRPISDTDVSLRLQDLGLDEDVPAFSPFFISVVEESDLVGEDGGMEHAQELLREYERREGVAVGQLEGGGDGGEEKYEKTGARHGDAVFSRFMKTISPCPQQILRYCRGGKPLFISEPPPNMASLVSACGSCGGSRTFELQLMPALVSLLRRTGGGEEAELEFGTVLVYTCTNSCWTSESDSPVDEFCFVQTDPDQQLFK